MLKVLSLKDLLHRDAASLVMHRVTEECFIQQVVVHIPWHANNSRGAFILLDNHLHTPQFPYD